MRPEHWFYTVPLRLRSLFRRAQADQELDDELRDHLERKTDEYVAKGVTPEEARRRARLDLGGIEQTKEKCRDARRVNWIQDLIQDLRFGRRMLRKSAGFTAVAVVTLALGIGANTAVFSIVNSVLIRPLAYQDPGQLYLIRVIIPQVAKAYPSMPANITGFRIWQREAHSFDQIAIADGGLRMTLTGKGEPEEIEGVRASTNFFNLLGIRPSLGRNFLPEEDGSGRDHVVIVTDSFWRRSLNADPSLIGKTITLDGALYEVIGVLPASFHLPKNLGPLTRFAGHITFFKPLGVGPAYYQPLSDFDFAAIARRKPGVTVEQAEAELNVIQARMAKRENRGIDLRAHMIPLEAEVVGPARQGLLLLLMSVAVVLLIVCLNVANLLLSRVPSRMREAAIRTALGASRARLIRQFLTESVLLGVGGGLLGIFVAYTGVRCFVRFAPVTLPRLDEVQIDARVLIVAIMLSTLIGAFFGVLPARRIAQAGVQEPMKAAAASTTENVQTRRLREALISAEVGLSTVLVILAGLLISSLIHLLRVNPGFAVEHVLSADIQLPPQRYSEPLPRIRFFDQTLSQIRGLPGVYSAAWVDVPPLGSEGTVSAVGLPNQQLTEFLMAHYRAVSIGYFDAAGIPLVKGRSFRETDRSRDVVIISENLAKNFWPRENPVGQKCVTTWGGIHPSDVIGVVKDTRTVRLDTAPALMIYFPQSFGEAKPGPPASASIIIRSSTDVGIAGAVRDVIHRIDPEVPLIAIRPMTQIASGSIEGRRFQTILASLFGSFALLLASLGVFGVVAYSVEQRQHELAIRTALGANASDLSRMVLRQGMTPVTLGLALGLGVGLLAGRLIQGFLFAIKAFDPFITACVVVATIGSGLAASYIPARRAMRVDPMVALKYE